MKISTRASYGARLMLDLALQHDKGFVFLKDIAKREALSEKYLSQIVIPLRAKGLIVSSRGAHGGYMLARPPQETTMRDVVETLEGTVCMVECMRDTKSCKRYSGCVTRSVWRTLGDTIRATLASITLQDLVDLHNKKKASAISYDI